MSWLLVIIGLLLLFIFYLLRKNRKITLLLHALQISDPKVAEEDVLKNLYFLEKENKKVRIFALSGRTGIPTEILTEILKKLSRENLIIYRNGTLALTPDGKQKALQIIRFHRIYEKWLFEKTSFPKKEWHKIADLKEHYLSQEEINTLYRKLGYPLFDPHGDPIPSPTGELPPMPWIKLSEVSENSYVKILHLEDEPENIYFNILEKNISVGDLAEVLEKNNNEILLKIGNQKISLALLEAENIHVELQTACPYNVVPLTQLRENETAEIVGIKKECRRITRRRLLDLGFVRGAKVKVYLKSIFQDPVSYEIKDSYIALRSEQARNILIRKL